MARVSSHALNGVDGSHAGGVAVKLINLATGEKEFDTKMDDSGRLVEEVVLSDPNARYELVFETGAYWQGRVSGTHGERIIEQIAVRFTMPDLDGHYHIPLILSPHGYYLWSSTEHG